MNNFDRAVHVFQMPFLPHYAQNLPACLGECGEALGLC
jgi:hypothetical protein